MRHIIEASVGIEADTDFIAIHKDRLAKCDSMAPVQVDGELIMLAKGQAMLQSGAIFAQPF